jgi:hypothetical protein
MTHFRAIGQGLLGLTFCGLLAVATFALGYWQGQRVQLAKDSFGPTPAQGQPLHKPQPGSPFPSAFAPKAPANVTPEMAEFRQHQEKLAQSYGQMHGTNGAPNNAQALARFQQENAALLQRQHELAQTISQQQARNPLAEPPPLQIPPNATAQQKTYLTARDQLQRDQVAFLNQHKSDDPATRQAAMQQWRQQNSARIKQLQSMSQSLAQNSVATPTTNPPSVHP